MSKPALRISTSWSPRLEEQVDEACDRFESAWKSATTTSERPRIEKYLGALAEPERLVLLRELVILDIYYRRQHGEDPRPPDYGKRFLNLDPDWLAGVVSNRAGCPRSKPEPYQTKPSQA